MKLTANSELRRKMREHDITLWQLAEAIGCHVQTVNSWMRTELRSDRRDLVDRAIEKILNAEDVTKYAPVNRVTFSKRSF